MADIRHAHSLPGQDESLWEPLAVHLAEVAALAASHAEPFGGAQVARAAGLLHDIGKCSAAYQAYIRDDGPSPDHSTAGALEAVRRFAADPMQRVLGRLIAFAVAGHHAGLADGSGPSAASLDSRLAKSPPVYPGWEQEAAGLTDHLALTLPNRGVPVVVATSIQFFESLHAARTSRCRKLHNLAGSVIVLGEAQTLPVPLLRPCMSALDELAASYSASVVLCTVIQPAPRRERSGTASSLPTIANVPPHAGAPIERRS